MYEIIKSVLGMRGYCVSEKVLDARDYGPLTKRRRFCMVASIGEKPFQFPEAEKNTYKKVADILEIPVEDRIWLDAKNSKTIAYTLEKEKEDIRKGNGFRMAKTYLDDEVVATITKGYYKIRLTDPILVHPEDESRFSQFTPRELARLSGLDDDYRLPKSKTPAGECIGQGVAIEPFEAVGKAIIGHIRTHKTGGCR